MQWDHRLAIPTATVDADPIAAPAIITQERIVRLQPREPKAAAKSRRLIMGLHAPAAEWLGFEVWALDAADDDPDIKPAAQLWTLVWEGTVMGGEAVQSLEGVAATGLIVEGAYYIRIVQTGLTATRTLLIRATA